MVPALSSAARIPLPGAVSAATVFAISCVDIDIKPPSVIAHPTVATGLNILRATTFRNRLRRLKKEIEGPNPSQNGLAGVVIFGILSPAVIGRVRLSAIEDVAELMTHDALQITP